MSEQWLGRTYSVLARGVASVLIIVGLFIAPLWVAVIFLRQFWSDLATQPEPWTLPLLLGFAVGCLGVLAAMRMGRTRIAEWYVYFESYFETLRYPLEAEDER